MEPVNAHEPFPVSVGDVIELDVHDQPYGDAALGRFSRLAVFVPGAVAGDRVLARVTEVHTRYARADLISVVTSSPDRVPAECPLAGRCGGCQWQTTAMARQHAAKHGAVVEALRRVGKWEEPPVRDILPSGEPWRYRNKARYAVVTGAAGTGIGYFGTRTHDLVSISRCPLNMERLDALLDAAHDLLINNPRFDDLRATTNSLTGRTSAATGETLLRVAARAASDWVAFAEALRQRIPFVSGVVVAGHPRRGDRVVWGSGSLTERVRGNEYRVSAASFFQVNPFAVGNLVDTVADAAGLQGSENLVDAYGGVGLFCFALCRDAARVFLIESDASALRDARAIADAFRAQNVTIVDGSVERAARRIPKADTIICDPPREGAGPGGIRALVSLKPRKLVYVACDPASLARDSNILRAEGFRLAWAQPLDMFPHTYHVETVALFER